MTAVNVRMRKHIERSSRATTACPPVPYAFVTLSTATAFATFVSRSVMQTSESRQSIATQSRAM